MAAITNQPDQSWKQAAMQKAERLTDLWDVTKAWVGRAAEIVLSLCMFAQLIGVLPGVHYWAWVDNFILSIQMIMLDMGAFALHTLAEQARTSGQEEAADKADRLATFLIRLMITTIALIIIGQMAVIFKDYAITIQTVVSYAEMVLILVRVVSTVKYIHTIHSLRGSTALHVQSVQPPVQPVQIEHIDELKTQIAELAAAVSQVNLSMPTSPQGDQYRQESEQSVQTYTATCTEVHALKVKIDSIDTPVQVLNLLNQTVDDAHVADDEQSISEDEVQLDEQASCDDASVDESTPQEDAPLVYPFVSGISEEVVKQIIDLHLSGVAWSVVGTQLSKNYSRIVKPVRDAYTQANSNRDTDRQPVPINLYRQAVL